MISFKHGRLKEEVVLEIGKFTILWALMEHTYYDNNCGIKNIYKNDSPQIGIIEQERLASIFRMRRDGFTQLTEEYVNDGFHPTGAWNSKPEHIKMMEDFIDGKELSGRGCLMCICRIRNNMLHGLKSFESLSEQLCLFKAMNEVLESIEVTD